MSRETAVAPSASSNWLALKKKLPPSKSDLRKSATPPPRQKRKHLHESEGRSEVSFVRGKDVASAPSVVPVQLADEEDLNGGDTKSVLRKMISGELKYSPSHQQVGRYVAMDCEMVGVGPGGSESSLARVSVVNFYGYVLLDVFVRQRERVVDYRTQHSGIRPSDLVNARPFVEVQKEVADLMKDRMLVGHAVHNDLKVLLLSHPRQQTRDTQVYAHKHKVVKTNRVALRNLVKQELDVIIQSGEHSSVTDARATMAVYRLHRKEWEKGHRPDGHPSGSTKKRKRAVSAESQSMSSKTSAIREYPGGGRKGVSTGLSTVISRKETSSKTDKWWTKLG